MNIYESIEGLREQFTGRFSDFSFHLFLISFLSTVVFWFAYLLINIFSYFFVSDGMFSIVKPIKTIGFHSRRITQGPLTVGTLTHEIYPIFSSYQRNYSLCKFSSFQNKKKQQEQLGGTIRRENPIFHSSKYRDDHAGGSRSMQR